MNTINIRGIPVTFPFEPYELQKHYMEKVIECLQNETNAVLESPTGTGKTLSLLCASLAWLSIRKAQFQAERFGTFNNDAGTEFVRALKESIDSKLGSSGRQFLRVPTIIYASRTHSQLSQAMNEMKRTAYSHMKATVVASREQLCINPDVVREEDFIAKRHLCRSKIHGKCCHFYNNVDRVANSPFISELNVVDIEDIITHGKAQRFCPYYMVKEMTKQADIIFMPYNYLLDSRTRKTVGVELSNNIIILDEAHNINKICEDSASLVLSSADITLCIAEVTDVMTAMASNLDFGDNPADFTPDELCTLKQALLDFEKAIDSVKIVHGSDSSSSTFDGDYIFEILKKGGIDYENCMLLSSLIDKIIQFLSVTPNDGPFQRKGNGLEAFNFLLTLVYAHNLPDIKEKIKKCYTVYIEEEQPQKNVGNNWLSKATSSYKNGGRSLNFWCFSPGFGMGMLLGRGVRNVILTSGTLAPLKPFISELEMPVAVTLENPHIIKHDQVVVTVLEKGPDGIELNSSFRNRDNPDYISSLGRTILNLTRMIPNGMLIFFPSYPIMQKCTEHWQENGIWSSIYAVKAIYVEPRRKEAFTTAMTEYYARVADPNHKGAIFLGVCRGKISEGLDFADKNGRAVLIIGLPFSPLKDPKVILKRKYLNDCRVLNKEMISGDEWYSLEASRAVNQAIGRVIRHRHDYGAIILLDSRFAGFKMKNQMSQWLRDHIKVAKHFGEVIRCLREFYRNAEKNLPSEKPAPSSQLEPSKSFSDLESITTKPRGYFNFNSMNVPQSSHSANNANGLVTIHSRSTTTNSNTKRRRIAISNNPTSTNSDQGMTDNKEYMTMVRRNLNPTQCDMFIRALTFYKEQDDFDGFTNKLNDIFLAQYNIRYIIQGLQPYIRDKHKEQFEKYWEKMR
ncbi:hypothetical protein PPYR_06644 [Photinus pyralis]|uniref:Regulator of telomere elongation helicase 1 homolog n=1 Tax=Photinus pyralis TaxID=7054 RepID=A0A5N4AN48_PHOPY|nr:regulator of telomere elongation helicase 1 homolog [Photinus pyralis]XP_031341146.1 regulator of telomere elongation helicase 1 homolog [Photinus pyralis]KAB0798760.1 hypothetical protein PPYR_06640 [Photinus pyralis]KAB0798764.1 hypothetical protein PPYR_06644 [Photinus pyralis]